MKRLMRFIHAGADAQLGAGRIGLLVLVGLLVCVTGPASADTAPSPYPSMAPLDQYLSSSQEAEIAVARSAAPKSVSGDASVMVLTKSGYETVIKGKNGFTCLIQRSWAQDFDAPEFWNPHARTPECWNAAAVSSYLPEYLKRTQWVLAGVSKDEMLARTKAAWASHEFGQPTPISMVYMLSKDQYINDTQPGPGGESGWYPHIMFFVPSDEEGKWGQNQRRSPIFATTSDVEPVTTCFIVVPRWSDGTVSPYLADTSGYEQDHH